MDKHLIQVRIERLVRGKQDMFGVTGYVREQVWVKDFADTTHVLDWVEGRLEDIDGMEEANAKSDKQER
jgi:hypothetical protein